MPYYSYGYGYDSANLIYLILLVPVLLLSLYAQAAVSGNFSRYSKVTNRRGLTGAQAAASVLRSHGITDVGIARCSGKLTDHYDPRNNTIFLSDSVYDAATVAAVGVAAHEAGHAVQYAVGYGPVKLRSAIVKTTQLSSQASFIILMLGLVLYSQPILLLGIVLFGVVAFFQLVTLPVEFNASHRALETLEVEHILEDEEMAGAERLGIECMEVRLADGRVCDEALAEKADIVVCDVPCSGLGIIRKKPDIRYKDMASLAGLPAIQSAILDNASRYVRRGGTLVYSTCTVLPEENERVTDAFLRAHPDFTYDAFALPDPIGTVEGHITLWPQRHGTDGFYICRMTRRE